MHIARFANSIGPLIGELRKRMHLSQEQLGQKAGIHTSLISKWERGLRIPHTQSVVFALGALEHRLVVMSDQEIRETQARDTVTDAAIAYWRKRDVDSRDDLLDAVAALIRTRTD